MPRVLTRGPFMVTRAPGWLSEPPRREPPLAVEVAAGVAAEMVAGPDAAAAAA